jgi:Mn2+/Fe2+ NRAMP family transporter
MGDTVCGKKILDSTSLDRDHRLRAVSPFRFIAAWGPGLLVMLADTDAGNVVTAAAAGAQSGYRLLPLLLLLVPVLYLVQELTVRLGIFTGRGHGELIREHFGPGIALLAAVPLAVGAIGSLVTEFTGIAGVGELYGLPRLITLPLSLAILLMIVGTGSYRRIERAALIIGAFQFSFFIVAWIAHPDPTAISHDATNISFGDRQAFYLAAAIVGAVLNPWMVFYQQSAVVENGLQAWDIGAQRWATVIGAILTQTLTAAVLIAIAAKLAGQGAPASFNNVGEIIAALSGILGGGIAQAVFSAGVLGAAMLAAIVSSLALAWGIGELAGYRRSLEYHPFQAHWFYGVYAVGVIGSATTVWLVPDLVWLNIAAQVLNVFLLPPVLGCLMALAMTTLPESIRLRGLYLWVVAGVSAAVCGLGFIGGIVGLF